MPRNSVCEATRGRATTEFSRLKQYLQDKNFERAELWACLPTDCVLFIAPASYTYLCRY